jgi:hypothetical protein
MPTTNLLYNFRSNTYSSDNSSSDKKEATMQKSKSTVGRIDNIYATNDSDSTHSGSSCSRNSGMIRSPIGSRSAPALKVRFTVTINIRKLLILKLQLERIG